MHRAEDEIMEELAELILTNLEELYQPGEHSESEEFIDGEKYAYVECLEVLQKWSKAKFYGLNFDAEQRYPLK